MNMKSSNNEVCNEALDTKGDHAVCCECGPFRTFRHNDLADVYADIFGEAGACSRRGVFVPEFPMRFAEAWLDVWGFGVPE